MPTGQGTATIDFGAFPGGNEASVAVTGETAISATSKAEAATTKAPRRIVLPFVQQVTAAQAVNTTVAQNVNFCDFGDAPVFVNPGEFVQLCTRHIGTVGTSGTVVHRVTPVFGWE